MAIRLPGVAISNLKRPITNAPISLLNVAKVAPRSILAQFNWVADYGASTAKPNVNVLVSMQGGQAQLPIDAIRSVKIDNLGNPCPVYVYFLDTKDTIVAPPNTLVWEPVVTNSQIANVILEGATDGTVGNTNVYFCNVVVPPFVNAEIAQAVALWKASATVSRGGNILNTNYGTPALCDQSLETSIFLNGPAVPIAWPLATGFVYINVMQAVFLNTGGVAAPALFDVRIAPGLGATPIWHWVFLGGGVTQIQFPFIGGMNLKIDASLTWLLFNAGPETGDANFRVEFGFTVNPT